MARADISPEEIADRISAYVYGNILTLAALVVLHHHEVENGSGLAIVAGTALSTYVAHAYAESLGGAARGHRHPWSTLLRDGAPILSAGVVPALLMVAGAAGWFSAEACLRTAEAWVVVRLGLTAFIVGRIHGLPVTLRTWIASVGVAAVALVIVVVKVALTH